MHAVENVSLASMTTLRLGGPARHVVAPDREKDVIEAVATIDSEDGEVLVVGGGSNLVVSDDGFAGTVLKMAIRGVDVAIPSGRSLEPAENVVLVTAAAGESWDELVVRCVTEGLAGVECLAGIPGLVGAVPMQNVGAYGQDVSETIVRVRTWDRVARRVADFDRDGCRFSYRNSVFRGGDGHVILGVTFALAKSPMSAAIRHAELARALGVSEGERAPLALVRETVLALRRKKGMVLDDADLDTASAGSFFTNPVVDAGALAEVRDRVRSVLGEGETMPVFPDAHGRTKLSAGWLIERAGFAKGYAMGPAAISSKHALALTNRGGATTRDLLALARAVREGVKARFGVVLENEPVFVGVTL